MNQYQLILSNKYFLLLLITGVLFLSACKTTPAMHSINAIAFRLKPGEDLIKSIDQIVKNNHIQAGWISTCVGSLTDYNIRFANQPNTSRGSGHFEIVGLTGTVAENGSHLHISISDSTGKTIGGHLSEGCIIYTTAEIVISSSEHYIFKRAKDGTTPWDELQIEIIPQTK